MMEPPTMALNLRPQPSLFCDQLYVEKSLIDDLDNNVRYICVDPNEVNPICERETGLRTPIPEIQPKKEIVQRTVSPSGGHGFLVPDRKVKLEMEEFSDLSSFLQKPLLINSVDELNTPVFIKDAFDFDIFGTYKESCSSEPRKVKLEKDAYTDSLSPTEKSIDFSALIPNSMHHQNENITSGVTNVHLHTQQQHRLQQQQVYNNLNIYTRGSENDSAYNYKISPPSSVDTTCALSVGTSDRHYSNASSPDPQSFSRPTSNRGIMTPEDSDCSVTEDKPILRLDVNMRPQRPIVNLDTPIIIEEVVDLESAANFNILDLVNNEDLSYLDSTGIFSNPSVSTVTLPTISETAVSLSQKQAYSPGKRGRKRKTDDDDEDYVPPTKQSSQRRVARYSDSDSDSEEERRPRGRPRGRPAKRAESVSSDNDASKYRELRDKNNEASRRSRLKRKCKELEFEKEAEELYSRNIKLKAQVEELEKMVNNFRDNLFRIMIRKS